MQFRFAVPFLIALLLSLAMPAPASTTVFTGARILPVTGAEITDGVLVVEDGQIRAVGARGDVRIPRRAEIIELDSSQVIIPGIVDTHSHIGEIAGADRSGPAC